MLRVWASERPRAVFVGWDTLTVPTYRHEALPAYQAGREIDRELLDQLDAMPELCEALGLHWGKVDGYEADDFLAAATATDRGPALVLTSDRDAFQLVSDRVTILQPVKGVSELARIGPAEVRERYGVDPAQVPDLIALRGDPSDRIPGAPGIGPKKAALLLAEQLDGGHQPVGGQRGEHGSFGTRLAIFAFEGVGRGDLEAVPGGFHVVQHDISGDGDEPGTDVAALVADRADPPQRP
jgi:5'-3' exonuclease